MNMNEPPREIGQFTMPLHCGRRSTHITDHLVEMVLEPPQALSIPATECEESMPSLPSPKQRRLRRCRPTTSRLSAHRSAACSSPATERRSWKLPFLITITNAALMIAALLSITLFIPAVSAHGYLKTPRSRNLVACEFCLA